MKNYARMDLCGGDPRKDILNHIFGSAANTSWTGDQVRGLADGTETEGVMKRIGRWMGVVLAGALFLSACAGKQQPSSQDGGEDREENRESLQTETELQEPEIKLTVAF